MDTLYKCLLLLALALMLMGCTITKVVPVETVRVQTETTERTIERVDSIYLHDSVYLHHQGDTVYLEKFRTKYRDRILTDTLYRHHTDSVYREVAIKVDKPPSLFWRIIHYWGLGSLIATILIILYLLRRIWR